MHLYNILQISLRLQLRYTFFSYEKIRNIFKKKLKKHVFLYIFFIFVADDIV